MGADHARGREPRRAHRREHPDRLSRFCEPGRGARVEDGNRRHQQMDRRNFTRLGPADRDAVRCEKSSRPALEGPGAIAVRTSGRVSPDFFLPNRAQNLKIALAEIIFALARPVQVPAGMFWLHSLPTLPKFSYSMRTPLSPSKKYCAPKPLRRLVSLNWRPELTEPTKKPLLSKVNLVWEKNAPNRP